MKVVAREREVEIAGDAARLLINASGGELVVDAPTTGVWELGASRAGVGQVLRLARDEVARGPLDSDETRAVFDAVMDALRAAAADAAVCQSVVDIRATPLVFAATRSPYLRQDAERFRACRIAIAHIESDADDDATPEGAAVLVERLAHWRDLYALEAKARRALNLTLARFGDTASVYALWGLRAVPLSRPVASEHHLEVLGTLGAHPKARQLRAHMALVEAAGVDALAAAVARAVRYGVGVEPAHMLAEVLAAVPNARGINSFEALWKLAHDWWSAHYPDTTKTALPPISLPQVVGIRFLTTFAEVIAEGKSMRHCVAGRRLDALVGKAFLFHCGTAQHGGATVQVNEDGEIAEARGPKNNDTATVHWARATLAAWGRGFWAARVGLDKSVARIDVPGALATVADCLALYQRACAVAGDDDRLLERWWVKHVARARCCELALVPQDSDEGAWPLVLAVDAQGAVVASTADVLVERGLNRRAPPAAAE